MAGVLLKLWKQGRGFLFYLFPVRGKEEGPLAGSDHNKHEIGHRGALPSGIILNASEEMNLRNIEDFTWS